MIRRRGALQIGIGHTRRVLVTKPMALSVTGWKEIGANFPSSGTGGPSATAPLTSQRMALRGVQLVSGEKTAKQFVEVWRTVQLPVIMAPAHMETAPAIL